MTRSSSRGFLTILTRLDRKISEFSNDSTNVCVCVCVCEVSQKNDSREILTIFFQKNSIIFIQNLLTNWKNLIAQSI